MKKKIIIFLLMLIIPTNNIEGFYCKYSDIAKYKGLASNITTFYEYIENENNLTFSITLVNLNENLYIVDATSDEKYYYDNNELTIYDYEPGQVVKYKVYSTDENCANEVLYTIRVILPDYNPFYMDPVCDGISNYVFCQKWYKNNLDYDSFVAKVNSYKESLNKEIIIEQDKFIDEYNFWDSIISFWNDYYHVISISIILLCGIFICIANKKNDI